MLGVLLTSAFFYLYSCPAQGDPTWRPLSPGERLPSSVIQSQLSRTEEELVAQLLAVDLKLARLEVERQDLEERLRELQEEVRQVSETLANAEKRLSTCCRRLGAWVRYFYEYGRFSYLEIIFDAKSLNDLVRRLETVKLLWEREVELKKEIAFLVAGNQKKLKNLEELENEMMLRRQELAEHIKEASRVREQRQAVLEQVRRESLLLAERIESLEREWYGSLVPLQTVLGQLNRLFAEKIKPDRITFQGKTVVVDISARQINRGLQEIMGRPGEYVAVKIIPGCITVAGRNVKENCYFSLKGELYPDASGRIIRFRPYALEINGSPVKESVLELIARDGDFTFALGKRFPLFSITKIVSGRNKITIVAKA
ncbi:MAG: hypothetical protein H0Z39_06905 [Peptococcaceae bacterium]|nr:hypothetical protein [Peptococcaceae bacterium]